MVTFTAGPSGRLYEEEKKTATERVLRQVRVPNFGWIEHNS
jgi:hypothetical protein